MIFDFRDKYGTMLVDVELYCCDDDMSSQHGEFWFCYFKPHVNHDDFRKFLISLPPDKTSKCSTDFAWILKVPEKQGPFETMKEATSVEDTLIEKMRTLMNKVSSAYGLKTNED
jgi:hypothetical protein